MTKIKNPLYSEVHSEVIHGPQHIRTMGYDKDQDMKLRSRIPKMRNVVEIYKQRKRMANEEKEQVPLLELRQSSIPRLKKNSLPEKPHEETLPTEKEFDKIYDEIVLSDDEVIDTKVLDKVKVEDPEKIENIFDEIIHDYEENKIKPIEISEVRSRIPLVKQKSLPEEQMVKKLVRRLSVKDIKVEDDITTTKNNQDIVTQRTDNHTDESRHVSKLPKLFKPEQNINKIPEYNGQNGSETSARKYLNGAEDYSSTRKYNTINDNILTGKKLKYGVKHLSKVPLVDKNEQPTVRQQLDIIDKAEKLNAEKIKTFNNKIVAGAEIVNVEDNDTMFGIKKEEKCDKDIQITINNVKTNNMTQNAQENEKYGFSKKGKVSQLLNEIEFKNYNTNNLDFRVTRKQVSSCIPNSDMPKPKVFDKELDTTLTNIEKPVLVDNYKTEPHETNLDCEFLENDQFNDEITIENKLITGLAKKIRRDSIDRFRSRRSESIPIDIAARIISNTPPNTPNSHSEIQELLNYERKSKSNIHNNATPINVNDTSNTFNVSIDDRQDILFEKSYPRRPERVSFNENPIIHEDLGLRNIKTNEFDNSDFLECVDDKIENKTDRMISLNDYDDKKIVDAQNIHVQNLLMKTENIDDTNFITKNFVISELSIDETNQTLPVEAVNREFSEQKGDDIYDEDIILKGKVSRMISRLHSVDESIVKKEVIEIPIKKTVSSKIAMFEQRNKDPSKAKFLNKPKVEPIETTKPRIIDQVLKPLVKENPSLNYDGENSKNELDRPNQFPYFSEDIVETGFCYENLKNIKNESKYNDERKLDQVKNKCEGQISAKSINIDDEKMVAENIINSETEVKQDENEALFGQKIYTDKVNNSFENFMSVSKSNIASKELKFSKLELRDLDTNLRKSKSMAELSLVKGKVHKVHEMIGRMNSVENLDVAVEKKDIINIKERPRRKSVSDKIALFERKLIPTEMDPIPKPIVIPTTVVPEPKKVDNDYSSRIDELVHAKETYGTFSDMVYVTLRNGVEMPVVALGTALMDPVLLPYIIGAAIDMGFRAIDTAYIYGNEDQVGAAIRAKIDDGTVKREDLFIIGKLWSTFHRRDLVQGACEASLKNLGIQYFDLYMVHNPMSFKEGGDPFPKIANVLQYSDVDYLDAWYGMEQLVQKGLAKSIGVSNFNSEQIGRVVDKARIKPVINQVECHPYLTQVRLDQFCSDRDIRLMCFGTLGSKGTPEDLKASKVAVIDDPLIKVMAAGLNITPAQLLIRYQVECGHVVVTKASRPRHLREVLDALTFKLSPAEVDALQALNRNKRTYSFTGMGDTHKNYPFKIPY